MVGLIASVAVIGAGNGGCAAAADLGSRGYEVRLYNRSPGRLAPIADRGGIEKIGVMGEGFVDIPVITNDIAEAVRGADLVMSTLPISSLPYYVGELAPHLAPDQALLLNPGHTGGGLFVAHEIYRLTGRTDIRVCETATLTYGCRMREPTVVHINSVMVDLPFSAFPGRNQEELFGLIKPLYREVRQVSNVLESAFLNINAVEHPPQAICNTGWVEHTRGDYLFYYEGTTPSVGRVIDSVDRERLAVADALGIPTQSFVEVFHRMGYTSARAVEEHSAYAALQDSAPNRWIKGPASLDHRYLHEDVGWGLVPWSEFGREQGVATPTMDALISLGGAINALDYRSTGLTLDRLGLSGIKPAQLDTYLYTGIQGRA